MLLQRNGTYFKRIYSALPIDNFVSPEEVQRLQNCEKLKENLLSIHSESFSHLDDSLKSTVDLHLVYSRLIEARDRCEWAGLEIPSYVDKSIDDLVEKAFASKVVPKKMGFIKRVRLAFLRLFA